MSTQTPPTSGAVTLRTLQEITRLPDDVLFRLLRDGTVRCSVNSSGEILVDAASITTEQLAKHLASETTTLLTLHDALIRERLRGTIRNELDLVVAEAIQILQNRTISGGSSEEASPAATKVGTR